MFIFCPHESIENLFFTFYIKVWYQSQCVYVTIISVKVENYLAQLIFRAFNIILPH